MKVIITEENPDAITVQEELEPGFTDYFISQVDKDGKENKITLTEYQIDELIRTLRFIKR